MPSGTEQSLANDELFSAELDTLDAEREVQEIADNGGFTNRELAIHQADAANEQNLRYEEARNAFGNGDYSHADAAILELKKIPNALILCEESGHGYEAQRYCPDEASQLGAVFYHEAVPVNQYGDVESPKALPYVGVCIELHASEDERLMGSIIVLPKDADQAMDISQRVFSLTNNPELTLDSVGDLIDEIKGYVLSLGANAHDDIWPEVK